MIFNALRNTFCFHHFCKLTKKLNLTVSCGEYELLNGLSFPVKTWLMTQNKIFKHWKHYSQDIYFNFHFLKVALVCCLGFLSLPETEMSHGRHKANDVRTKDMITDILLVFWDPFPGSVSWFKILSLLYYHFKYYYIKSIRCIDQFNLSESTKMACQSSCQAIKLFKLKLIAATLRFLSIGPVTIFRLQVLYLHLSASLCIYKWGWDII